MKITEWSNLALNIFKTDYDEVVSSGGNRANETVVNLSKNNKSKNLICIPNIRALEKFIFLIPNLKKIFNHLKQAFIKALIF